MVVVVVVTFAATGTWTQVPYFNAPIFLENKQQIGRVEEIFGPINSSVGAIARVRLPSREHELFVGSTKASAFS